MNVEALTRVGLQGLKNLKTAFLSYVFVPLRVTQIFGFIALNWKKHFYYFFFVISVKKLSILKQVIFKHMNMYLWSLRRLLQESVPIVVVICVD